MSKEMDVYSERAAVVIALARAARALGHDAYIGEDPEEPEWPVLFIELPTGQVSWHIWPEDLVGVDDFDRAGDAWDGHDTEEKYRRLAEWQPE